MKKLFLLSFTMICISASAQYATYTPIETPRINNQTTGSSSVKVREKEEAKEEIQRLTGYYANLNGETSRVSIKITAKQGYTGEVITLVGYHNGSSWVSTRLNVFKTGYGDPKGFDFKVGIANIGAVYFNY